MSRRDTHFRRQADRHMVEARRGLEKLCIEFPVDFDPITSASRDRLAKVELLLRSGRHAEATLLANIGAWCDQARDGVVGVGKANFNPDEPRDDRGKEWTKLGEIPNNVHLENVQYRGHFHDSVVDYLINSLKQKSDKVLKNPRIIA